MTTSPTGLAGVYLIACGQAYREQDWNTYRALLRNPPKIALPSIIHAGISALMSSADAPESPETAPQQDGEQ